MDFASPGFVLGSISAAPHYKLLLSGADTAEAFGLITLTLPPHDDSPLSTSDLCHAKGCYVVRGTLAVTIADRTITVQPGEAVYIAPGVQHTYWNPTATLVEALLILTPSYSSGAESSDHYIVSCPSHITA
jgi:quercetin dioxygenase-like cupin family protein